MRRNAFIVYKSNSGLQSFYDKKEKIDTSHVNNILQAVSGCELVRWHGSRIPVCFTLYQGRAKTFRDFWQTDYKNLHLFENLDYLVLVHQTDVLKMYIVPSLHLSWYPIGCSAIQQTTFAWNDCNEIGTKITPYRFAYTAKRGKFGLIWYCRKYNFHIHKFIFTNFFNSNLRIKTIMIVCTNAVSLQQSVFGLACATVWGKWEIKKSCFAAVVHLIVIQYIYPRLLLQFSFIGVDVFNCKATALVDLHRAAVLAVAAECSSQHKPINFAIMPMVWFNFMLFPCNWLLPPSGFSNFLSCMLTSIHAANSLKTLNLTFSQFDLIQPHHYLLSELVATMLLPSYCLRWVKLRGNSGPCLVLNL